MCISRSAAEMHGFVLRSAVFQTTTSVTTPSYHRTLSKRAQHILHNAIMSFAHAAPTIGVVLMYARHAPRYIFAHLVSLSPLVSPHRMLRHMPLMLACVPCLALQRAQEDDVACPPRRFSSALPSVLYRLPCPHRSSISKNKKPTTSGPLKSLALRPP